MEIKEKIRPLNLSLERIIAQLPGHVYWKDKEGICLGCNDKQAQMIGFQSATDCIGKTLFELISKEDARNCRKNDLEVLKSGMPQVFEEPVTLNDGTSVVMLSHKLPLLDGQGAVVGLVGVSLDITEHKKQEKLLQTKVEQFDLPLEHIVTHIPGHVYWKDKEGVCLGSNDGHAQIFGFRFAHEIVGLTAFDVLSKEDATLCTENDLKVMHSGTSELSEESVSINGQNCVYLSQKSPLRNKQGEVIGILGISFDITEKKEAERALKAAKEAAEAANKVKIEFLENMRHDIRTPLAGILGFANIIKHKVDDPSIEKDINNLLHSSRALLNLVNEVLDVIKMNAGEIPLEKKKFQLNTRLQEVIHLNCATACEKNLGLHFEYDPTIPRYLIGDPTRIHRIALELITNALKFTEKGQATLSVTLSKRVGQDVLIKMVVEDTGIGIPADKQKEIFTQFKRLTPAYEGRFKGIGLGLSIVMQFVEDLKGELYVESHPVNSGTKITCLLPLRAALIDDAFGSEAPCSTVAYPETSPPPRSRVEVKKNKKHLSLVVNQKAVTQTEHRILLVEDHLLSAKVVSGMLSILNCQVDVASTGKMALSLTAKNTYDLIFMDIGLPDLDGYEITKQLRLQEAQKGGRTPIVALTAHVDTENKHRCLEAGMNKIVVKPIDLKQAENLLTEFVISKKETAIDVNKEDKIIDFEKINEILGGDEKGIPTMITILLDNLPQEIERLQQAYQREAWGEIKEIAHALKGGYSYCGAARLQKACVHLEDAITTSQACAPKRFHQVITEIEVLQEYARQLV